MRRIAKKNIADEADLSDKAPRSLETLPLHLYNTVIQQLKQQKHELQVQSQAEQRRARTSENFSQCGALQSFLRRAGFRKQWSGQDRESRGQGNSRFCLRHRNGRGRYFSRSGCAPRAFRHGAN